MVNVGPLYCSPDRHSICKVSTRTVTDSAMMRINVEGLPPSQSFLDIFRQFGILDLQWILGGMPCGLESATF